MTVPDDTRPLTGASTSHLPPSVVARCEGCELVVEVDVLGALVGDQLDDCSECGSPIYVIDPDNAVYLAGFGAGWDAAVALMVTGERPASGRVPSVVAAVAAEFDDAGLDCGCIDFCDCEVGS